MQAVLSPDANAPQKGSFFKNNFKLKGYKKMILKEKY